MRNFEKIKKYLEDNHVEYKIHEVDTDDASVDSHVKALGIKYAEGLSTLFFKVKSSNYIAILRRDDRNINSKVMKKILGTNDFTFCNDEDLIKLDMEPGLGSPFLLKELQKNLGLKVYVDNKVEEMTRVICGSGSTHHAVETEKDEVLKNIGEYEILDITIPNEKRQDALSPVLKAQSSKLRILSGITPSSSKGLHLGNYLGAVKPQVEFQDKGECFYFIADYHALNTIFDKETFANNVYATYLDYLALGIDLNKTTFFIESHVKSIFELTEILKNVVTLAEMKRMHAFKDKLADPNADIDQINMGLFNYPILMAADILVFEPDIIPVGEDQTQHVEICREMARTFNNRYGQTIKIPELYVKKDVARVPGTDGIRKMGKSLGNDLTIFANEETIKKQIMGITTDPNRIKANDPGDPEKNVIFKYMKLMDYDPKKIIEYEGKYKAGTIGDVELKNEFCSFFLDYFRPFRDKRAELVKDKARITKLMKENADKANKVAEKTIEKVRKAIGAIY